jgi:anti-anti-sigma regulatory factor
MLKIQRTQADDERAPTVLRLAGRVTGVWVDELRHECHEVLRSQERSAELVVLDLRDVSFVDEAGVALLRELVARRVRLINASPFVLDQLGEVVENDAQ